MIFWIFNTVQNTKEENLFEIEIVIPERRIKRLKLLHTPNRKEKTRK